MRNKEERERNKIKQVIDIFKIYSFYVSSGFSYFNKLGDRRRYLYILHLCKIKINWALKSIGSNCSYLDALIWIVLI